MHAAVWQSGRSAVHRRDQRYQCDRGGRAPVRHSDGTPKKGPCPLAAFEGRQFRRAHRVREARTNGQPEATPPQWCHGDPHPKPAGFHRAAPAYRDIQVPSSRLRRHNPSTQAAVPPEFAANFYTPTAFAVQETVPQDLRLHAVAAFRATQASYSAFLNSFRKPGISVTIAGSEPMMISTSPTPWFRESLPKLTSGRRP